MAYQKTPGQGTWLPLLSAYTNWQGFANMTALTANGMKVAFVGRVFWADRSATKNLQKIGFRFGNPLTKAGGSTIQVSLQNVSTVAGNPNQPAGTVLQSFTVANANIAASTNIAPTAFSGGTTQSLNYGQLIAVVFEFATFGGSDSIPIAAINYTVLIDYAASSVMYNNTTWTANTSVNPICLFQFDDGSYGCLDTASNTPFPSALSAATFNSGSSPNEYALQWQLPYAHKIDAVALNVSAVNASSAFNVNVYDGTTPLATVAVNPYTLAILNAQHIAVFNLGQEVVCQANHTYYVSLQPTSANNVAIYYSDVASNAYLETYPLGVNGYLATRSGGAWSTTNTRVPAFSIRMSSLDDGAGGGPTPIFLIED